MNWAALRPSSAPPRPSTASSSFIRSNSVRTRVGVSRWQYVAPWGYSLAAASPFLCVQGSSTPRRPKCDPVALHARREAGWKSSSFLANRPP